MYNDEGEDDYLPPTNATRRATRDGGMYLVGGDSSGSDACSDVDVVEVDGRGELPEERCYRDVFKAPTGLFRSNPTMGAYFGQFSSSAAPAPVSNDDSDNATADSNSSNNEKKGNDNNNSSKNTDDATTNFAAATSSRAGSRIFSGAFYSEGIVPLMRKYPNATPSVAASSSAATTADTASLGPSASGDFEASTNASAVGEAVPACAAAAPHHPSSTSAAPAGPLLPFPYPLFTSLDIPLGMKESPASRFLRGDGDGGVAVGPSSLKGIVFPIDADVNRAQLQDALCGGAGTTQTEGSPSTPSIPLSFLPWLTKHSQPSAAADLAAIRALGLPREAVHVGYVLTLAAEVALIAIDEASEMGKALLGLIPFARPASSQPLTLTPKVGDGDDISAAIGAIDAHMSVVFPFLKAKSRSDPDAMAIAEKFLLRRAQQLGAGGGSSEATAESVAAALAGSVAAAAGLNPSAASATSDLDAAFRKKGNAATDRAAQREVAAARKACAVLREGSMDVWRLASYLLGRPMVRPKSGTERLLSDKDALALQWVMARGRPHQQQHVGEGAAHVGDLNDGLVPCEWKCFDFEAACVVEHDVSVPLEGAVVEAVAGAPTVASASLPHSILEQAVAEGKANDADDGAAAAKGTPALDALLAAVGASTAFYSMINPGHFEDSRSAIRLALMGCAPTRGGHSRTVEAVFGHGIPFDCLLGLRSDYRALAAELVAALGIGHLVLLAKEGAGVGGGAARKPVLVNKGPTLVDLNCLRWVLAAANLEARAEAANGDALVSGDEVTTFTLSSTAHDIYDLSFEAAQSIPFFDISAVAKLVGVVEHALTVRAKGLAEAAARPEGSKEPPRVTNAMRKELAAAAERSYKAASPIALSRGLDATMLCACGYHWDLHSSGCGEAIAAEASRCFAGASRGMRNATMEELDGIGDDDEANHYTDGSGIGLSVDIHCARSDAFYLKCQVEQLLSRL